MSERYYSRSRLFFQHFTLNWQIYLCVVGSGLLIVGCFIVATHLQKKHHEKERWPVVEAILTQVEHRETVVGGKKSEAPYESVESQLSLLYHVDGQDYRTQYLISFRKGLMPRYREQLQAGETVPIYVSPDDPKKIWLGEPLNWLRSLEAFANRSRQQ